MKQEHDVNLPALLTVKQAAELLGVSIRTLYPLLHSDDGPPAIRVGERKIGIPRDGLLRWIDYRSRDLKAIQ